MQKMTGTGMVLQHLLLLLGGLGRLLLQGLDGGLVGLDFTAVGLDLFVERGRVSERSPGTWQVWK
jgi:hypothetical protein